MPPLSDDDRLLLDQAMFLERAGTPAEAERVLARLSGRSPTDAAAALACVRAGALARLRGDPAADALLRRAAEVDPTWRDPTGLPIAATAWRHLARQDVAARRPGTLEALLDAALDGLAFPTVGRPGPSDLLATVLDELAATNDFPPGALRERAGRARARLALGRAIADAMGARGVAIVVGRVAARSTEGPPAIVATWLDRVGEAIGRRTGLPLALSTKPPAGDAPWKRGPAPLEALFVGCPDWRLRISHGFGMTPLALGLALYLLGGLLAILWIRRSAQSARMQADFVAAVSHEMKTPIAGIQAMAEMLADGRVPEPARARVYAERIRAEASRLGAGVRNVLDAARIERDPTAVVRPRPLEPSALVLDLASVLRPVLEGRGFAFRVDASPSPRPIPVDPDAFSQVVGNLLDNAAKFSTERREIDLTAAPSPGGYRVAVSDRGPGVPDDERVKIFERFRRGEHARRAAVPGVGLGLHVAQRLVEAHGGTIRIATRAGGGAEFVVTWPEGRS